MSSDPASSWPRTNPDHQLIISRMLCKMGADVIVVENGQTAVARALQAQEEGNAFNLILMDIRMPVMDGAWQLGNCVRFDTGCQSSP